MKVILKLFAVFWLLVLSSGLLEAQCPNGKTAFVWVNGILVPDKLSWEKEVKALADKFFLAHPTLNPMTSSTCVVFDSVYNTSQRWKKDMAQSAFQWTLQEIGAVFSDAVNFLSWVGLPDKFVSYLKDYKYYVNFGIEYDDPDLANLLTVIAKWSDQNYTVVLVGHSQGTFYTDMAYEAVRDGKNKIFIPNINSLPNSNKLSVVNIASAADRVSDGRGKYTTQCGDIILAVFFSLSPNVSNSYCGTVPSVTTMTNIHLLSTSYLVAGSATQQKIYKDLEDSLYKPMTLTPETNTISIVQGVSGSVDLNLKSENGISGTVSLPGYCMGVTVCPSGFTYNFQTTTTLYANGTVPLRITFNTQNNPALGTYNYEFWGVLNGNTAKAKIAVTVTAPPVTTGTINISMLGYFGSASCSLNGGATFTVPASPATILANQIPGGKNLSCQTVSGYTMAVLPSATQTLLAGGTIYYSLVFTPTNATPLTSSCSANPATITAGQSTTFTGISSGGISPRIGVWGGVVSGNNSTVVYASSASLAGNSMAATYTVTDSAVPKKTVVASCSVQVLPLVKTGTVIVMTNGTVPSVSCTLNGASVTGPGTFSNQAVGTKTLSCTPPSGFTLTSITPYSSQTLSAGGTVIFTVNLTSLPPVLSRINVNTNPKVNTNISVTLTGSGFVSGMLVYVCTSSSTSSCSSTPFTMVSGTQINLSSVRSSTARTLYLRVTNSAGVWSNYLTMVVIK